MELPTSIDAERFVLGAILGNNHYFEVAAASLQREDFSLEKHRRLFSAMGHLHDDGAPIDCISLVNQVGEKNLEAVGGLDYIVSLYVELPQIVQSQFQHWLRIVKDKSTLRQIIRVSADFAKRCYSSHEEPGVILSEFEGRIRTLLHGCVLESSRIRAASDLLPPILEDAKRRAKQWEETHKPVMGIPSGLHTLDALIDGFNPRRLYLLAGGPAVGKTTLALRFACEAARHGNLVLYVTYENSPWNLVQKALCATAEVTPRDIERGVAHIGAIKRMENAAQEFMAVAHHLHFIEGSIKLQPAEIRMRVRDLLERCAADTCLVIVDYLQFAALNKGYRDQRVNVSALAGEFHALADQLSIPVLALSSQNRDKGRYGADGNDNKGGSTSLDSLKESRDLEYSADIVMFLHPSKQPAIPPNKAVDLTISKNRYGAADETVHLIFRPQIGDFREETKEVYANHR